MRVGHAKRATFATALLHPARAIMEVQPEVDITRLLGGLDGTDREGIDAVVRALYDPLRRMAHARLGRERTGHTLTTTALVHEAYLALVDGERANWNDRAHFLAAASRVMRNILVDYARRRNAQKRGGDRVRVELDEGGLAITDDHAEAIEDLHEALTRLESVSPRQSRLLEQRYFGGLKLEECAAALGISRATVARDLKLARAWLACELNPQLGR